MTKEQIEEAFRLEAEYRPGSLNVRESSANYDVICGSLEGNELSQGAADVLAAYLLEWMSRQALLRFVHTTALARPHRVNVLQSFFEFLVYVVSRVLITAEILRKYKRQENVTPPG